MARFIRVDEGWINLDHVGQIIGREAPKFYTADRKYLGTRGAAGDFGDVELEIGDVVPARPGDVAVVMRTTAEDVAVKRVPIVAWRVMDSDAVPVLVDAPWRNDFVFVEQPDGKLIARSFLIAPRWDATLTLEEAKALVRELRTEPQKR
jgi:hypothetical protein